MSEMPERWASTTDLLQHRKPRAGDEWFTWPSTSAQAPGTLSFPRIQLWRASADWFQSICKHAFTSHHSSSTVYSAGISFVPFSSTVKSAHTETHDPESFAFIFESLPFCWGSSAVTQNCTEKPAEPIRIVSHLGVVFLLNALVGGALLRLDDPRGLPICDQPHGVDLEADQRTSPHQFG